MGWWGVGGSCLGRAGAGGRGTHSSGVTPPPGRPPKNAPPTTPPAPPIVWTTGRAGEHGAAPASTPLQPVAAAAASGGRVAQPQQHSCTGAPPGSLSAQVRVSDATNADGWTVGPTRAADAGRARWARWPPPPPTSKAPRRWGGEVVAGGTQTDRDEARRGAMAGGGDDTRTPPKMQQGGRWGRGERPPPPSSSSSAGSTACPLEPHPGQALAAEPLNNTVARAHPFKRTQSPTRARPPRMRWVADTTKKGGQRAAPPPPRGGKPTRSPAGRGWLLRAPPTTSCCCSRRRRVLCGDAVARPPALRGDPPDTNDSRRGSRAPCHTSRTGGKEPRPCPTADPAPVPKGSTGVVEELVQGNRGRSTVKGPQQLPHPPPRGAPSPRAAKVIGSHPTPKPPRGARRG